MSTVARIALAHFDPHLAERLTSLLRRRAHSVCTISMLRSPAAEIERLSPDLFILDISVNNPKVQTTLAETVPFHWRTGLRPMILCVSSQDRGARFQYDLERKGVRLVSSRDVENVLRAVDLALLELADVDQNGPTFSIVHRYRVRADGALCQAGEEVARIVASYEGGHANVRLGLATRLFFDYLARTRHTPQSAGQIAGHMRLMPFYRLHGMNCGEVSTRKICKSCIREYVKRIRVALGQAFRQLSFPLDPKLVLERELVGNEAQYALKASIVWVHVNDLVERAPRIRRTA